MEQRIYEDGLKKCCIRLLQQMSNRDPTIGDMIICDESHRAGCGNGIVWDEGANGPGWQVIE